MSKQATDTIMMIEPVSFGFNEQTATNNYFQKKDGSADAPAIQASALAEFNAMALKLRSKGINLIIVPDTVEPHTPDSIFPNNWISFHENGYIGIYPMCAKNRRNERRSDILHQMVKDGFRIYDIHDYSASENDNKFLEGTGSMVLDREYKIAYAALSERTDADLFSRFCTDFGYKAVSFHANQTVNGQRLPIYHTNVMMCIADRYAVICLDSIDDLNERKTVTDALASAKKEVIEISEMQMHHFAGNMLQVLNAEGKSFLVMSQSAYDSLDSDQIERLTAHDEIIHIALPTIEKYGGGSARCMMAEVFLPRN